ncbi:MAG: helix-turn-helix transcriptional regulator [Chitinophagaceae bacterium]|nr:helix-turn-helix transcriptional regulator [Chitinophagaceae bacterium]
MQSINIDALSKMIKSKRGDRGLREVAKEIGGVSVSTLSRVENGNLPDIDTYMKLCKWLEVSIDFFTTGTKGGDSKKQMVVANLRADKTLPKDISEALIKMINLAYSNVKD